MFGHQDENSDQQSNSNVQAVASDATSPTDNDSPVAPDLVPSNEGGDSPTPETSTGELREALSPAGGYPQDPSSRSHTAVSLDEPAAPPKLPIPSPAPVTNDVDDDDDLIDIKKQALEELLPLVDKLDQTPEERFRTLMMLIQASDQEALIPAAYETAHKIEDEKVKAQALLDIVNEINYFTQNTKDSKKPEIETKD